jgi:hypothetical protein
MQLKQNTTNETPKRNERNDKDNKTEDRNEVLKQIANNNKVYKITAIIDKKSTDQRNSSIRIVGCNHIKIFIDGKMHTLGHAWLREDMIDGLVQMTFNKKIGSTITLYVKVKQYTREKGKEEDKYEFTNK